MNDPDVHVIPNDNDYVLRWDSVTGKWLRVPSSWQPSLDNAPSGWGKFFLVRPKGVHPGTGKAFIPTVVQRSDGQFYTDMNTIEPIYFGQDEEPEHQLKTELEWCHIPEGKSS